MHRYFASVCLLFKNEASVLKEWIEYYRLLGFEHFYLFDNGSTDNWRQEIGGAVALGLVTVVPFLTTISHENMHPSYKQCAAMFSHETLWCAFVDSDEFLCLTRPGDSVKKMLEEAQSRGAHCILLNWLHASSWGRGRDPQRMLTVDAFPLATKAGNPTLVKCIVQLNRVRNFADPHCPWLTEGSLIVDCDGAPVGCSPSKPPLYGRAFVYHLYSKSLQDYLFRKLCRVHAKRDVAHTILHDPQHIGNLPHQDIRRNYGGLGIEIWRLYDDPLWSTPLPSCSLHWLREALCERLQMHPAPVALVDAYVVLDHRRLLRDHPAVKQWMDAYKQRPNLQSYRFFDSHLIYAYCLLTEHVDVQMYELTARAAGFDEQEVRARYGWHQEPLELLLHYWGNYVWHLPVEWRVDHYAAHEDLRANGLVTSLQLVNHWYSHGRQENRTY